MSFFYDTNALLDLQSKIFDPDEKFYICNITLKELENIKTSSAKDENTKYKARNILRLLDKYEDYYETLIYRNDFYYQLADFTEVPNNDDTRIIATALNYDKFTKKIIFVTKDLSCKAIAKAVGLNVYNIQDEDLNSYTGFKELIINSDIELANFYSDIYQNNKNPFDLLYNEYLLIRNQNNEIIDKYKWTTEGYKALNYDKIDSRMFGKLNPKDIYQQFLFDSLSSNQLTVIRGKAGTGKSLIGLAYLFQELEKGHIDKILMFVNPVATRDSCKFGFLPGTDIEKILGSQIGKFLATKIGDMSMVEKLIADGRLILMPVADCRGVDTSGLNCGIYVTEAQNTTIDIMKLMLQRVGENTICIFEGDDQTQVDMASYAGSNNGLKRLSEVFRGEDYYGEITLQKCYRSRIAEKAEEM